MTWQHAAIPCRRDDTAMPPSGIRSAMVKTQGGAGSGPIGRPNKKEPRHWPGLSSSEQKRRRRQCQALNLKFMPPLATLTVCLMLLVTVPSTR